MAWSIEISSGAERELRKLERATAKRLVAYLSNLAAETTNPREPGKGLTDPSAGLWRYRVGDYRIICQLLDERLVVLVIRFGHRSRIYD